MPSTGKQLEFDRQLDLLQIKEFRRTGDMEVLGALYQKYMHLVYGVCLKYLKSRSDAQDAVISIFEKLTIEAIRQEIVHFKNWLFVVTKNHCLMEIRKRSTDETNFSNWQEDEKQLMELCIDMHPLDESSKLSDALQDCITRLKDEQKDCINLFYFKKKCYRDIGKMLHIEEKAVKSSIQNAKRNLKICLERKHE